MKVAGANDKAITNNSVVNLETKPKKTITSCICEACKRVCCFIPNLISTACKKLGCCKPQESTQQSAHLANIVLQGSNGPGASSLPPSAPEQTPSIPEQKPPTPKGPQERHTRTPSPPTPKDMVVSTSDINLMGLDQRDSGDEKTPIKAAEGKERDFSNPPAAPQNSPAATLSLSPITSPSPRLPSVQAHPLQITEDVAVVDCNVFVTHHEGDEQVPGSLEQEAEFHLSDSDSDGEQAGDPRTTISPPLDGSWINIPKTDDNPGPGGTAR